jgi:murein DD-endopeptidase MepM/ murein hydrolase activator NlpD
MSKLTPPTILASLTTLTVALFLVGCQAPIEEVPSDEEPRLQFRFPIQEANLIFTTSMGVDHDPEEYGDGLDSIHCTAFDGRGFPACYDGHDGTDYELKGGFPEMDRGSATIIAAAAGEVIRVVDGHYDRCHLNIETWLPDCDGYPMKANKVVIRHDSGHVSFYIHLMKDSPLVEVGQWVDAGEPLGLVGSSGHSTAPHLHFEVEDADGTILDPYAGEWSQPESYWCDQGSPNELPGICE